MQCSNGCMPSWRFRQQLLRQASPECASSVGEAIVSIDDGIKKSTVESRGLEDCRFVVHGPVSRINGSGSA
jgi:hypothetical protein